MNGATFDGAAMTQRGYALYDLGEYPALVLGTDGVVHGEVYRVTPEHLEALDRYEGYPELYGREPVALADGSMAVAYVMSGARLGRSPRIEGGLWKSSG